jgi:hypothetical protein
LTTKAFGVEGAGFFGREIFENIEDDFANNGEVFGGVATAGTATVLIKSNVKAPV